MTRKHRALALLVGAALITLANVRTGSGDFPKPTKFNTGEPHRRYLRDLSQDEIKAYMKRMAADIGVKCNFCHEGNDYTSEAIPMKDFARKKIGMLNWLNDKYRPDEAPYVYSCYSCHRGQVRPVPSGAPASGPKKP